MVAPNRQRMLSKVLGHLGKRYAVELPEEFSVLDHLLLGVLQEGTSVSHSLDVYRRLLAGFYDLNELRVSHYHELELRLEDIPERVDKAKRMLQVLQFVFETTYTFDLESMRRKPLKQAQKQLSKITGVSPFAVAAAVQRALGGHALPIDEPMCAVLARFALVPQGELPEEVRTGLEHLVPKASGCAFCVLVSELAADPRADKVIAEILPKPRRRPATPKAKVQTRKAAKRPAKRK